MKKILILSSMVLALSTASFAEESSSTNATVAAPVAVSVGNGDKIYKKCIACHGAKAEKSYLNKVPALNTLNADEMVADMKAYKAGTVGDGKGKFGLGGVMKGQMATLSDDDMKAVADYITTLK